MLIITATAIISLLVSYWLFKSKHPAEKEITKQEQELVIEKEEEKVEEKAARIIEELNNKK